MECERLRDINKDISEKDAMLREGQKLQNILEMELQILKAEVLAEKVCSHEFISYNIRVSAI